MDVLKQPIQKFEGQVDDLLVSRQSINFVKRQQWLRRNHEKYNGGIYQEYAKNMQEWHELKRIHRLMKNGLIWYVQKPVEKEASQGFHLMSL